MLDALNGEEVLQGELELGEVLCLGVRVDDPESSVNEGLHFWWHVCVHEVVRHSRATITWGICTRRAGKLYRARSRLYRSRFLQVNMRWKALAEIYTMHSFAPFSMLKIFVKNR